MRAQKRWLDVGGLRGLENAVVFSLKSSSPRHLVHPYILYDGNIHELECFSEPCGPRIEIVRRNLCIQLWRHRNLSLKPTVTVWTRPRFLGPLKFSLPFSTLVFSVPGTSVVNEFHLPARAEKSAKLINFIFINIFLRVPRSKNIVIRLNRFRHF